MGYSEGTGLRNKAQGRGFPTEPVYSTKRKVEGCLPFLKLFNEEIS